MVGYSLILLVILNACLVGWLQFDTAGDQHLVGYSLILLVILNAWLVVWLQFDTAGDVQHLVDWLVAV